MRRLLMVFIVLMLLAVPARALAEPADVGVMPGLMRVSSPCGGFGPGLGLLSMTHTGYLMQASVLLVVSGAAQLTVCGDIGPVLGLGASCLISQGANGAGTLANANGAVTITDAGWTVGVGGTLLLTATVDGGAGELVALVQTFPNNACLAETTDFTLSGVMVLVGQTPPGGSGPGPTPPPSSCQRQGVEVDRYDFTVGAAYTEVAVYQTPTEVETCVFVSNGGSPVVDRSVRVPTEVPPPLVTVDPDAPAGDDASSPCDVQHFEGGNSGTRGYARTSTVDASGPEHVCVGVRSGGSERHVRVTIG